MMKKIQIEPIKLIVIAIGFLTASMIFLPVLVFNDSSSSFSGLEVAFGHEFANLGPWASGEITYNPMVLIAFSLPFIAAFVLMFSKKGYLVSSLLFIISTFLILMVPQLTTTTITLLGNVNEIDVEWVYGTGLIAAAALSILGGLFSGYRSYQQYA